MFQKISPSLRLALLYLFFSGIWILGSDALVQRMAAGNNDMVQTFQSVKGLLFIILGSIMLFFFSRGIYRESREALLKSESMVQRYKALLEASREGIIDHDLIADTAIINEQMKQYLNEPSDLVEHFSYKHRQRIHPEDRQGVLKNFRDTLASGAPIWQADYRCRLSDDSYHDVSNRGSIVRNENQEPVRFISIVQDVTELRNMRTAFYEQQIRHKQLLGQHIIEAQEAERERWARELHDNAGQLLTVIKLYLDRMEAEASFSPELLHKSREMTIKALDDLRQLSASIKPPEFSANTLSFAIETLLANISRVKIFESALNLHELDETQLTDEQKLMIYRIVQEQVNNILKYAEASLITISIKTADESVFIEVKDNGKGFDVANVKTGIGLRNIRNRLQVYSGSMKIRSSPGAGCTLMANFSLI